MKKKDLKTGMIVVNSKNSVGVVQLNTSKGDVIVWKFNRVTKEDVEKYRPLSTVKDDLSFMYGAGRITEVYAPKDVRKIGSTFNEDNYTLKYKYEDDEKCDYSTLDKVLSEVIDDMIDQLLGE